MDFNYANGSAAALTTFGLQKTAIARLPVPAPPQAKGLDRIRQVSQQPLGPPRREIDLSQPVPPVAVTPAWQTGGPGMAPGYGPAVGGGVTAPTAPVAPVAPVPVTYNGGPGTAPGFEPGARAVSLQKPQRQGLDSPAVALQKHIASLGKRASLASGNA